MNTFLIKVGKSWQVIKRDGFVNGSKRVLDAFFALFRSVGSGDILFVSGGVGDSARYRTNHVAEELEFNGFKCSIAVQDNPRLVSYVNKFSIFVFHRTLYTQRVAKMIKEIKKQNKTIIFETDDLVYDPKYLEHMDYYKKMNSLERKLYENGVGGEILRDDYVNVATTTTEFLAQKLQAEGKQVFIVPNKLSVEDVKNAEIATQDTIKLGTARNDTSTVTARSLRRGSLGEVFVDSKNGDALSEIATHDAVKSGTARNDVNEVAIHRTVKQGVARNDTSAVTARTTDKEDVAVYDAEKALNKKGVKTNIIKLGYFSGTISHNKDFATITKPLLIVMKKYKNVELLLIGPLDVESDLVKKFGNRIKQLPYVARKKHFANIAKCDINLAPLEYDNPFCEAKSELKFFEAGVVKVPTIAIDNQTYKNAIIDGEDGSIAKNSQEWIDKLSRLIEDENLRKQIAQKAYQKTIENYTTQNAKNVEYYKYLKKVMT